MRKIIATGLLAGLTMGLLLGNVRAAEEPKQTTVHALVLSNGRALWVAALYPNEDKCALAMRVMNTSIRAGDKSWTGSDLGTARCVIVVQP